MRFVRRALPGFTLVACLVCMAGSAHAQPVDDTRVRADTLFREGQSLVTAGQIAAGCAKLEESQRMDPKLGRLLNVAYCHEQLGRTATAWSEYNQAAALALQTKQAERESFARERASTLSQKLSFVQLELAAAPDLSEVKVDGTPLARNQWALPFPIDPGTHTLSLAAPGRQPREQSVVVGAPGTLRVAVEALTPEPSAPAVAPATSAAAPAPTPEPGPAPPDTPPPAGAGGGGRTLAWVVGGAGVAALGLGTGFGLYAMSLRNQADPECPNKLCSPHGKSLIDDASTAATVATVAFVVGVVGVGASTWLFIRPLPTGGATVALQGAW
jgi:hypothetical protein